VCGCNNVTYDNQCIASSAGVSIESLGACQDVLPCVNDTDCDFGQYCRFDAGTCGGVGSCANTPTVCTLELNPVCGCDNVTYDNACYAQAVGVSILDMGPCEEAVPCVNGSDCTEGEYCHYPAGECGGVGSCTTLPEACTLLQNPVCGCDNVTYDNACEASASGASILSMGVCESDETVGAAGECMDDDDCPGSGRYCQYRDGACGGLGVCVETPQLCTLELRQVCGCDGRTYANRCAAQVQGVSVFSSTGGCASPRAVPGSML
jgi:hypothetical protein